MPAFEYIIRDPFTGEEVGVVTLRRPVRQRDHVTIERKTVPNSIALIGAAGPKLDQASEVLAGYRRQEEKIGSNREFHRSLGEFTPNQIKKAWSTPD